MVLPEPHAFEAERLALLKALNLLDTPAEPVFDAITRLAMQLTGSPIALISLVDEQRQWFKSRQGLAASETPRDISFCAHTVHQDAPLVVEDALRDHRFADNPLVTGAPHVRAYAGIPLGSADGLPLGTLCVIDHEPRAFSDADMAALTDLAELARREILHREAAVRAARLGLHNQLEERVAERTEALQLANDMLSHAMQQAAGAHQALQDQEADLRAVLENALDAYICIDEGGRIVEWNRQAELTFGWSRAEAVGRSLHELIIPRPFQAMHLKGMAHLLRTGEGPVMGKRLELPALTKQGGTIPCEVTINALPTARSGHLFFAFLHDITDRKRVDQALAASEHRLRTVADNLPVLISYVDRDGRFKFCNRTYDAWLGIDSAAAVGKLAAEVFGERDFALRAPMFERALSGERVEFEIEAEHEGQQRHLHLLYLPDVAEDGQVQGFYALVSDVTASKNAQRQLARLARTDTLTGLPNRRAFEEAMEQALARRRRSGDALALLFLDIDHFKQINDTRGHGIGDEVLKTFASRLMGCVRTTDTVARLAGDEFVIILEGLHAAYEAETVARKIIHAMDTPFDLPQDARLQVSASIGVAYEASGHLQASELMIEADRALYQAKSAGRHTWRLALAGRKTQGTETPDAPPPGTRPLNGG